MLADEHVTITGSTNYDGVYEIQSVTVNTFNLTVAFVATDTGTFSRGTLIRPFERGFYEFNWSFSADSAGNNKNFQFTVFEDTIEIQETRRERQFGTAADVGSVAGGGQLFLEKDADVWFAVRNIGDATDIDLDQGSLYTKKIS